MKKSEELNLIDGIFKPGDARRILTDVFLSKIRYHQMNNLSSKERFGIEDAAAVHKIPILMAGVAKVKAIIEFAEKEGMMLELNAQVTITLKEPSNKHKEMKLELHHK